MVRKKLLPLVALLIVSSPGSFYAGDDDNFVFFSRASDLQSLRDVLEDGDTFARLRALIRCLPLWRISTAATPEASYSHVFDFGTPRRQTERVYRATVTTNLDATSSRYGVKHNRESYGTSSYTARRAMVTSEVELKVLQLALRTPEIYDTVVSLLTEIARPEVRDLTVRPASEYGAVTVDSDNEKIIGFHWGGIEGAPDTKSFYWKAFYNPISESASFTKWVGD